MTDFKWRYYQGQIILSSVRWYCKYGISYRDLEEMMIERGVAVDHTPLHRWVQHYAPLMEKRLRWYWIFNLYVATILCFCCLLFYRGSVDPPIKKVLKET